MFVQKESLNTNISKSEIFLIDVHIYRMYVSLHLKSNKNCMTVEKKCICVGVTGERIYLEPTL